jgi:hypothetical protein
MRDYERNDVERFTKLFRRAINGEFPILTVATKEDIYSGNYSYWIEGWTLVVFWDCGDLDYTDGLLTPSGTYYDYDQIARDDEVHDPTYLKGAAKALRAASVVSEKDEKGESDG